MKFVKLQSVELRLDEVFEGGDLLILQIQLHAQLGLQIHNHLNDIQRIDAQTFKGSIGSDLGGVQLQLLGRVVNQFLVQV